MYAGGKIIFFEVNCDQQSRLHPHVQCKYNFQLEYWVLKDFVVNISTVEYFASIPLYMTPREINIEPQPTAISWPVTAPLTTSVAKVIQTIIAIYIPTKTP